jgi:uncharacterized membrane protein YfcA
MPRLACLTVLLGFLCVWLGYEVLHALRTGVANVAGTEISRRTRPWAFWLAIAVQTGFGIISAVLLLCLLRETLANDA